MFPNFTTTYKLNGTKDPESPFTQQTRVPGWAPDAVQDTNSQRKEVFIEEAIFSSGGALIPFPVPTSDGNMFQEPASANDADWNDFNRWIHGSSASVGTSPSSIDFNRWIVDLSNLARRYNASLYTLRRLHLHHKTKGSSQMPVNPNGHDEPKLPPVDGGTNENGKTFKDLVVKAEGEWKCIVTEINAYLALIGSQGLAAIEAVEVNGYVVSLRVLANFPSAGGVVTQSKLHTLEVFGSSSSHISISSAFSSP
jgi:hypothetical protein